MGNISILGNVLEIVIAMIYIRVIGKLSTRMLDT